MAQVKKYKRGDEIARLEQIERDIQARLDSGLATEDLILDANNIGAAGLHVVEEYRLNKGNSRKRRNMIELRLRQLDALNGTLNTITNPMGPGRSRKQVLAAANADYAVLMARDPRNWIENQGGSGLGSETTSTTSTISQDTDNPTYYRFNLLKGATGDWFNDSTPLSERLKYVSDLMSQNISKLLSDSKGKKLVGISENEFDNLRFIANLYGNTQWNSLDPDTLKNKGLELLGYIRKYSPNSATIISLILPEYFKGLSDSEKAKKALTDDGYTELSQLELAGLNFANKYLLDNEYHILKKGNNYFVFNKDWSGVTNPYARILDDYLGEANYGKGFAVNDKGQLTLFDLNALDQILADTENPFYSILSDAQARLKKQNELGWMATETPWDSILMRSSNPLIKQISRKIHGKLPVDVSKYFKGDSPVIAVSKSGKEVKGDQYGRFRLNDPDLIFYYLDDKGVAQLANSYQELASKLGGFSINGFNENWTPSTNNYEDFADAIDFSDLIDMSGNYNGSNDWYNAFGVDNGTEWDTRHGNGKWGWSTNIEEHPEDWAEDILTYIGNKEKGISTADQDQMLAAFGYLSNPRRLLSTLVTILTLHPEVLDRKPELLDVLFRYADKIKRAKIQTNMQTEKNGGIVKAAFGSSISPLEGEAELPVRNTAKVVREKLSDKKDLQVLDYMQKTGYDEKHALAALRSFGSAADWLRVGALATDITATVAAISGVATGGAGTAAAGILGLGSMGVDLAADIVDPSVTMGEAAKNALINTGLAALGMVPGGGSAKILKSALRIVPRVYGWAVTAKVALDPEIHESVKKLVNQGSLGAGKLNTKDWQNLVVLLRTASAASRGVTMKVGGVKANKKINAALKTKQSEIDPNTEYVLDNNNEAVAIRKGNKSVIEKALKEGATKEDIDAANAVLPEGKTIDNLKTVLGENWWLRVRSKGDKKLVEGNPSEQVNERALAELLEAEDRRFAQKSQLNGWLRLLTWTDNKLGGGAYSMLLRQAMARYGMSPTLKERNPFRKDSRNRTGAQNTERLQDELLKKYSGIDYEKPNTAELRQRVLLDSDVEKRKNKLEAAQRKLETGEEELNTKRNTLESARQKMSEASKNHKNILKEIADLQSELTGKREYSAKVISSREKAVNLIEPDRVRAQEKLDKIQSQLDDANERLSETRRVLEEMRNTGKKVNKAAIDHLKLVENELKRLQRQYNSVRSKINNLNTKKASAEKALNQVREINSKFASLRDKQSNVTKLESLRRLAVQESLAARNEYNLKSSEVELLRNERNRTDRKWQREVNNKLNLAESELPKVYKNINIDGVEIKKGSEVVNYQALDKTLAKKMIPSTAVEVNKEKLQKLLGKDVKIRGAAYDTATGKLYYYKNGKSFERLHNYKLKRHEV